MAQRILPAIDLRTADERRGLSESQALARSLKGILQTITQGEKVRQERQQLDRIATAIAGGASTIEAIAAAANEPTEFAPGIRGRLQKAVGSFGPQGGGIGEQIQKSVISDALRKALQPPGLLTPEEQREGALIKSGIKPRATAADVTRPTEQTPEQKDLDRDIKILTSVHLSGPDKAELKATTAQRKLARDRMRQNPAKVDLPEGALDDQFEENVKNKPKVKVKGAKFDKAFGKEAYEQTLQDAQDAGLAAGITEESVKIAFDKWWDEQVALEDPKGFGKRMIPREEFEGGIGRLSEKELEDLAAQVK